MRGTWLSDPKWTNAYAPTQSDRLRVRSDQFELDFFDKLAARAKKGTLYLSLKGQMFFGTH